jgi:hypothetical protein
MHRLLLSLSLSVCLSSAPRAFVVDPSPKIFLEEEEEEVETRSLDCGGGCTGCCREEEAAKKERK